MLQRLRSGKAIPEEKVAKLVVEKLNSPEVQHYGKQYISSILLHKFRRCTVLLMTRISKAYLPVVTHLNSKQVGRNVHLHLQLKWL